MVTGSYCLEKRQMEMVDLDLETKVQQYFHFVGLRGLCYKCMQSGRVPWWATRSLIYGMLLFYKFIIGLGGPQNMALKLCAENITQVMQVILERLYTPPHVA